MKIINLKKTKFDILYFNLMNTVFYGWVYKLRDLNFYTKNIFFPSLFIQIIIHYEKND